MSDAETPVPNVPLVFGFGPEIDRILPAIAEIQAVFYSPHRNKQVRFVNKKGQTVDFRYTSYSALNDLLREPLRQQGLFFMHFPMAQPKGFPILVSRLIHADSGQYCYCTQELVSEKGMQDYGSARSFAARYAQLSLLNIVGDEDDDANIADGNIISSSNELEDERRTKRTRYEELVHLANTCRAVDDAAMAAKVLQRWNHDRDEYLKLPSIEGQQHKWPVLVRSIASALDRVHGPVIGKAWRSAIEATSQERFDELRRSWEGEWRADVDRLKRSSEKGYAELGAHMKGMGVRLLEQIEKGLSPGLVIEQQAIADAPKRDQSPTEAADTAVEAGKPAAPAGPVLAFAQDTPQPAAQDTAAQDTRPAAPDIGEQNTAEQDAGERDDPVKEYFLFDDTGDVIAEPYTDPVAWVEAYLDGLRLVEDRAAMVRYNRSGLAWASSSQPALSLLAPRRVDTPEAASDPAPAEAAPARRLQPIPIPMKSSGSPDFPGYIRALKSALRDQGRDSIREFYEAQLEVLRTLDKEGVRLLALTVCEDRIKQLEAA